jgi:hypothetical protein
MKTSKTSAQIQECWKSCDNWYFGFFYFAPEDPRIIVPKRIRTLGWTLNLARAWALPMLALLVTFCLLPFYLLSISGLESQLSFWLVVVFVICGLMSFCAWMARPDRYSINSRTRRCS